ncbi:MAG: hypothetical protein LC623_06555 [Halobacteriales archaeon]|nr:hypothetical protein [Halobacteriales archaeon]
MAMPVGAGVPGHVSTTFEFLVASYFDFKDGVGIADPSDQNNPCTAVLLGLRASPPISETWEADQNMGTNLNGPAQGISNLSPPLAAVGGWLPSSSGINLGVACPLPGSGSGNLWVVWSGANWRSAEHDSSAQINLCTQQTFPSSSPGCLALPGSNLKLWVSACTSASFDHDYMDGKGKYLNGVPFDQLAMKNQKIRCAPDHSHNYTSTVQSFGSGSASQTSDLITNDVVVHTGSGTRYMAVCWRVDYLDFSNPLVPVSLVANAHDWKLVIDLSDDPANIAAAIVVHYGGAQTGDGGIGPATAALRGFYDQSGDNGFGPCTVGPAPESKKPDLQANPEPTCYAWFHVAPTFPVPPGAKCYRNEFDAVHLTDPLFDCTPSPFNPASGQGIYKWKCSVLNACQPKTVAAFAHMWHPGDWTKMPQPPAATASVTAEVDCGNTVIVTAKDTGSTSTGAGVQKYGTKTTGDYACIITFNVVYNANNEYHGQAMCRDSS